MMVTHLKRRTIRSCSVESPKAINPCSIGTLTDKDLTVYPFEAPRPQAGASR